MLRSTPMGFIAAALRAALVASPMRPVFLWFAVSLALSLAVRVVLLIRVWPEVPHGTVTVAVVLAWGACLDAAVAGLAAAPVIASVALVPHRLREGRLLRFLVVPGMGIAVFGLFLLSAVEYHFFEEFSARLNYIAVDYLIYPDEVFVSIWESYPVAATAAVSATLAAAVCYPARPLLAVSRGGAWPWRSRLAALAGALTWLAAAVAVVFANPSPRHPNRLVNEVAGNGVVSFVAALRTQHVDYTLYYPTIEPARAWDIVRRQLPAAPPPAAGNRPPPSRPLNLVFVIEESLGAEFVGALGASGPSLTPELDRLAGQGRLFERVYATGNRTVRALEASLLSLPPLPGGSVVRAAGAGRFTALATILRSHGYATAFVYGGNALFDNLRAFALENGFDRVRERRDVAAPVFENAWGVSDEDVFRLALEEMDRLDARGRPFFVAILTVSNHKPFTFPAGRIDLDPRWGRRAHAVRYADWALGRFFREAGTRSLHDRTLFVVFGDHGPRVYGAERLPLRSYEVPLLLICPACLPRGERSQELGSTMDIAPTVLPLLGIDTDAPFYGRNLLAAGRVPPWVLMQHNREVALYDQEHLVVLGLRRESRIYGVTRPGYALTEIAQPSPALAALRERAIALYQTAYEISHLR
jgi:phosphoglycerol transferase MdoB-like AlkP superfamily enzyme